MKQKYVLRLYVVGGTTASKQSTDNLMRLLKKANIKYSLEIIDVLNNPEKAVQDCIVATPTLVKILPKPPGKIMGTFSDKSDQNEILSWLGL